MGIKYGVNEKFFEHWSHTMAYVLGYIYADGHLEDAPYLRGKYLRVTSVEKNNLLKIRKWLESKHKLLSRESYHSNGRIVYQLRIGSHKIYDDLVVLGLYPNKSLTIPFPKIPKKYLNGFIRGYFDGDGCVYLERRKNKKNKYIIKKLSVIFTSGSKKFLEGLCLCLKNEIDTKQDKIYNSHRSFQLRHNTADTIKIFKFLYKKSIGNAYLPRKYKIFKKYFNLKRHIGLTKSQK